jgi:FAD binding domain-containing protein
VSVDGVSCASDTFCISLRQCILHEPELDFLPATPFARSATAPGDVDPEAIQKLALSVRGRVLAPSNDGYGAARRVNFWNPKTNRRPVFIVYCQSNDDVARTVEFARRHSRAVAVRGGGHSYLGWGNL